MVACELIVLKMQAILDWMSVSFAVGLVFASAGPSVGIKSCWQRMLSPQRKCVSAVSSFPCRNSKTVKRKHEISVRLMESLSLRLISLCTSFTAE